VQNNTVLGESMSKEIKQKIAKKIEEKNAVFMKRNEKGSEGKTPYVSGSLVVPDSVVGDYFPANKPIFIFPEKGINMNHMGDIRRYNLPYKMKCRAANSKELDEFLNSIHEIGLKQIKEFLNPK
jgi:hypothetical protein